LPPRPDRTPRRRKVEPVSRRDVKGAETQRGRKWQDSASRFLGRLCVSWGNRSEAARLFSSGHRPGTASMASSPALRGSHKLGRSLPCAPPPDYARASVPRAMPRSLPGSCPGLACRSPLGREKAFGKLGRSALVFLWHVSIWSTIKPFPGAISQRKVREVHEFVSEEFRIRTAPHGLPYSQSEDLLASFHAHVSAGRFIVWVQSAGFSKVPWIRGARAPDRDRP